MTLTVIKACVLLATCSTALRSVHGFAANKNEIDREIATLVAKSDGGVSSALIKQKLRSESAQNPTSTSSHETFFDRMGNAFWGFLFGIVLILFSGPIMWINERRQARMESLLAVGESEYVTVTAPQEGHRGELVHAAGGEAHGIEPVECKKFGGVGFPSGCLRLRSSVEVYQWQEIEKTETKKDNVGGGQTKTTTYEYKRTWSTIKFDSSKFKQSGHANKYPSEPGKDCEDNSRVRYQHVKDSKAFEVPTTLVRQLDNFKSIHDELPDSVSTKGAWIGTKATKKGDYFVYATGTENEPAIGDMRVQFDAIKDGATTIMALQTEGAVEESDTFLPYRLVPRGFCCWGVTEKELKRKLQEEARKSGDELAEQDACECGPLALCCCCCVIIGNLVNRAFASMPAQIFHMFDGDKTPGQCMSIIKSQSKTITWILRGVSWLMMYIGTCLLFGPILVIPDLIPFLGGYVSSALGFIVGVLAFILTLLIAVLIMSAAYWCTGLSLDSATWF